MKKEWNPSYLRDLNKFKEITLNNSNRTAEFLPIYILNREFFEVSLNFIETSFKDSSVNNYLRFSTYQGYRILTLINCLNKAKLKFNINKGGISEEDVEMGMKVEMDVDRNEHLAGETSNTSQLISVNNIIKNSFELTSYVYLLEWLQGIYGKDDKDRANIERVYFEKTYENTRNVRLGRGRELQFNPDLLNSKNEVVDSLEMDKYNKLVENIVMLIRQGKVEEAQKTAEYYYQDFLSAMLSGGLPMNDFILDNAESLKKLDFDLFPPFMKTKELGQIKNNLKNMYDRNTQYENVVSAADQVVGNPNWLLWFHSVFDACDSTQTTEDKFSNQMKLLQSYLSGNPSFIEKNNLTIYDSLYTDILSMLNLNVIQEYSKDGNMLNHHFVDLDGPDFSTPYNRLVKGKSVIDIINMIKSKDKYKETVKQDFLLGIELEIIQLHFIDVKKNSQLYYERLDNLLGNIIQNICTSESFYEYLNVHTKVVDESIQGKADLKLSQNELQQRSQSLVKLVKLNYMLVLFNTLITLYATNSSKFVVNENIPSELFSVLKNIFKKFDVIITMYFEELTEFILRSNVENKPQQLVYILGFCLDIHSVQHNLTRLSQKLMDYGAENYRKLAREIDLHFKEYQEILNTNIANDTKIYILPNNVSSIDEILSRDLKQALEAETKKDPKVKFQISSEDELKINQIKFLFTEGKLEKVTILKYILKMSLKFLSNNKFKEALQLEATFEDILNIKNILGDNFVRDYNCDLDDINFIFFLESYINANCNYGELLASYGIELFHIGIYFTILFTKYVTECYSSFLNLTELAMKESMSKNPSNFLQAQLLTKSKDLVKKFKIFFDLVRALISNEDIKNLLLNFFQEDVFFNDIHVIISKWTFQILKWSADLYTSDTFKAFNLMSDDGLELIVDLLTVKEDALIKNCFLNNNALFLDTERSLFRYMDSSHERRKEVLAFIQQLGRINRNLLNEVLDDELYNVLSKETENYEF